MICEGAINLFKELPAKRKQIKEKREISLNPQEWMSENFANCAA
jgi:hypothetical protein